MKTVLWLALKDRGLSVREAAKLADMYPQTVYRHVKGERTISPKMAIRYEKALGIPKALLRPDLWGDGKERD